MNTPGADGPGTPGLFVEPKGATLHLKLNRPHAANALDADLVQALAATLGREQPGCATIVLSGAGADFCLGMDIAAIVDSTSGQTSKPLHESFASILERLSGAPLLTIALVRGRAMGGGLALAAACDVVVSTKDATFALPEALNGLVPANAALPVARRTGNHVARRLALTTEPVDADAALRIGLTDYVVSDDVVAEGLVRRLYLRAGRLAPGMIAQVKETFAHLSDDPATYRHWAVARITQLVDNHE